MRILLGTTPVTLPGDRSRPLIQNLGPGVVYLDTDGAVDAETGFVIAVGGVYEFPVAGDSGLTVVASLENTDVRVIGMG